MKLALPRDRNDLCASKTRSAQNGAFRDKVTVASLLRRQRRLGFVSPPVVSFCMPLPPSRSLATGATRRRRRRRRRRLSHYFPISGLSRNITTDFCYGRGKIHQPASEEGERGRREERMEDGGLINSGGVESGSRKDNEWRRSDTDEARSSSGAVKVPPPPPPPPPSAACRPSS